MTRTTKSLLFALLAFFAASIAMQAQTRVKNRTYEDYEVLTNQVVRRVAPVSNDTAATSPAQDQQQDFISSNFRFISMCDWQPGMRFMVIPDQRDLVTRAFTDKNNVPVSTNSIKHCILIYDGHSNLGNSLHERVDFHLQNDPGTTYHFELPTQSFADYCYTRRGVPSLAYLGDVDMAIDTLIGKQVRVKQRHFFQDSPVDGGGIVPVDLGDDKRGQVMTITKVGVGTRQFPVKLIIMDKDSIEYFQYVAISRTNSGLRDDEFERSDNKEHSFRDLFDLLEDRVPASPELQQWVGKTVYTMLDTSMKDANERNVRVQRLSVFRVTDIYSLGDNNKVTLTLVGNTSNKTYTKEVAIDNSQVTGRQEILSRLFGEGDPESLPNVRAANMTAIRAGNVQQGFTEAEVRLALGEPSDVTAVRNGQYQWVYQYVDTGRPFRSVTFRASTKLVRNATR